MSDLESEYRKALSRYPRAWRRHHEEALLGVLLDNAEAEGRQHMSASDRKDLAKSSRRLHVNHVLPLVLFVVAALAALFAAALLTNTTALDAETIFTPPAIPAPPVGGSYQPLFVIQQPAWVFVTVSIGVTLASTSGGLLLARSNVRKNRLQHP